MDMTPKEYQQYVQEKSKKSPILKDVALAFVIGGLICVVGQAIQNGWSAAGLSEEDAVVSPAIDFKSENWVNGVGAKMFTVAGPVIVYGTSASVIYGIILVLLQSF